MLIKYFPFSHELPWSCNVSVLVSSRQKGHCHRPHYPLTLVLRRNQMPSLQAWVGLCLVIFQSPLDKKDIVIDPSTHWHEFWEETLSVPAYPMTSAILFLNYRKYQCWSSTAIGQRLPDSLFITCMPRQVGHGIEVKVVNKFSKDGCDR